MSARVIARSAIATNIGMRALNEDSAYAGMSAFVVADGMGGHRSGEVASRMAVDVFTQFDRQPFVDARELESSISKAARRVARLASYDTMPGSTLTGLVFADEGGYPCARVFNIGDSRTYHLSGRSFTQITHDHSEVQELLDAGVITAEQSQTWQRRNVITRALGGHSGSGVGADIHLVPLSSGDRFVLCTDGLSSVVSDADIGEVARYMEDSNETAQTLVQKALGAGGSDNVTVLVVDIVECNPHWPMSDAGLAWASTGRRPVGDDTIPRKG
ncbi:MAG: protein phosphatase 2C domain-containing protein [Actinomycetaceae bacterium]|nr:protein phosphatase 2C domain-containing protein [Actinomycetaceae bacterium]